MTKFSMVFIFVICLFQTACSLAPSAANRSYKAYNAGNYEESLRLANRAISTYEYTDEDKANLLFLKAESYAKLKQSSNAMGVLIYIVKTYPDSEASYRAKSLLATLKLSIKPQPKTKKSQINDNLIKT